MEEYLQSKGIPAVLKNIVMQLCVHKPDQPIEFMIQYLQDNYLKRTTSTLSSSRTIDEYDDHVSDEEEMKDEVIERNIELDSLKRKRRGAICSEPFKSGEQATIRYYIPKSPETQARLENALKKNIMFAHLEEDQRREIFSAMFEVQFKAGDVIIRQGDEGDNFYVTDSGVCDVYLSKGVLSQPQYVTSYTSGGSFGELALIYGSPRAASVKAKTDVRLWAIDRHTFRSILMETTMKKRRMYESFLEKVPILATMMKYERAVIADALEPAHFADGSVIVRQGDPGDSFYIIVGGQVKVLQTNKDGNTQEVACLYPSDYFGEIALLTNRPRAATVIAVGQTKCVQLDREAFNRLLGPCEDILRRNMEMYNRFMSTGI